MRLADLLPDVVGVPETLEISGLVQDSRMVRPGDAFVAIAPAANGPSSTHSLNFVAQAVNAGASVVLFEAPLPAGIALPDSLPVPLIEVSNLRARLGAMANRFYGEVTRAMTVVGVTGTNGKTSTVQLLAQAWTLRGRCAGTIGTLGVGLYGQAVPTGFTTPLVLQLHRELARLRDEGADAVAMEVSSHALEQGRVDGVRFEVAIFTNLTRDHLDYHGTMEAYGEAKAKLFAWPELSAAAINLDDDFGRTLYAELPAHVRGIGLSSRGAANATVRADDIALDLSGVRFTLRIGETVRPLRSALLGRFNVDNLLAVAGALHALGETPEDIAATLAALEPVNGRMNRLGGDGRLPLVVVDYAHTPDALEQALSSLRAHASARLICVFGCGGDRDRGKRPQMAAIAETGADVAIVTDDNPRTESGDAIVADILAGFSTPERAIVERDRGAAIARAVSLADAHDIVLIAGKGHEPYQEIHGVHYPFDDAATARKALEARA
ncbi:MAG: UDP-N-acetylmuramoyl-L-alanyl-D-glutamate--2,6-diaminopimelate ligase [Xanthomonadaceae bacterium]|nr:UDP-N-acetylmuramoyl-L-alanyl-D-glutamate--2,6-diaminopimelate ligase [Xanthomonadaceae bacterium]